MSSLIRRAVDEFIQNHLSEESREQIQSPPTKSIPSLTGEQKKLVAAFDKLSSPSQKALLKFLETLSKTE